ncbi:MAG: hypothetical protein LBP64_07095 [Tannerella sp.]|jgi:hypothetical protein|nr:hypothetical protein [Tannerella sp.]
MNKKIEIEEMGALRDREAFDVLNLEQMSKITGGTEYVWVYIDGQWVLVAVNEQNK